MSSAGSTVSPSKISVQMSRSDHEKQSTDLHKAEALIEHIQKITTSSRKILPRDLDKLASVVRQLKLYLNVNDQLKANLTQSSSAETLISVLKRCITWGGILADIIVCIFLLVAVGGAPSEKQPAGGLPDLLCRHGVTNVCLTFLKKFDSSSEISKLACLELIVAVCDYATAQRSKPPEVTPGRDIVFDGSALVQNVVHLLVKGGSIGVFPRLVMQCHNSFDDRGAECALQVLLFILQNCSRENARGLCKAIDKPFVRAAVVALYRWKNNEDPSNESEIPPRQAVLLLLIAGLTAYNEEVSTALAADSRKWQNIGARISSNYQLFEAHPRCTTWYRGAFDAVAIAREQLSFEGDSGASATSSNTRQTKFTKQSKAGSRRSMKANSPIGNNNKTPVLSHSKSTIVSYEQRGESGDSGGRFSPMSSSFDERDCRPGSSVQYALELIAAENDPYHLDTDVTTTSAVLQRLTIGPYSGGTIQDRHDMPGSYHSPKRKSPKLRPVVSKQGSSPNSEVIVFETEPPPTETTVADETGGNSFDEISIDDGFIYEDVEDGPAELSFQSNEAADVPPPEIDLTPIITDFAISTPELEFLEGVSGQVSPTEKPVFVAMDEEWSESGVDDGVVDSAPAPVEEQPEALAVASTKEIENLPEEPDPSEESTKESAAESNVLLESVPDIVETVESSVAPVEDGGVSGHQDKVSHVEVQAEEKEDNASGGGGCCVVM